MQRVLIIDDSIDARLLLERFFRVAYPWAAIRLYDPVAAAKNGSAVHLDLDGAAGPKGNANQAMFDITEAITKDRVQVYYQQLVSVSEAAVVLGSSFYQMSSQLVDTSGKVYLASLVAKGHDGERMLDRWMLRKSFAELTARGSGEDEAINLIISISQETL